MTSQLTKLAFVLKVLIFPSKQFQPTIIESVSTCLLLQNRQFIYTNTYNNIIYTLYLFYNTIFLASLACMLQDRQRKLNATLLPIYQSKEIIHSPIWNRTNNRHVLVPFIYYISIHFTTKKKQTKNHSKLPT